MWDTRKQCERLLSPSYTHDKQRVAITNCRRLPTHSHTCKRRVPKLISRRLPAHSHVLMKRASMPYSRLLLAHSHTRTQALFAWMEYKAMSRKHWKRFKLKSNKSKRISSNNNANKSAMRETKRRRATASVYRRQQNASKTRAHANSLINCCGSKRLLIVFSLVFLKFKFEMHKTSCLTLGIDHEPLCP